jgi:hypothetical protein
MIVISLLPPTETVPTGSPGNGHSEISVEAEKMARGVPSIHSALRTNGGANPSTSREKFPLLSVTAVYIRPFLYFKVSEPKRDGNSRCSNTGDGCG